MVMTTSAADTSSSVIGLGNFLLTSSPISLMASTTAGLRLSAGSEPAERTRTAPSARWFSSAAAICDRPALWTQTNRTSGTLVMPLAAPGSGGWRRARGRRRRRSCRSLRSERHRRGGTLGLGRGEERERLEVQHLAEDAGRKRLQRGVEIAHVAVVEAPREFDLVLGVGELLLEVQEQLGCLELRVVLGHREQLPRRAGQRVLGSRHGGRIPGLRCGKRIGARGRDGLEDTTLVGRIPLHRVD